MITPVHTSLLNEINSRQIEFATLVNVDGRIVVNAMNNRTGFVPFILIECGLLNLVYEQVNFSIHYNLYHSSQATLPLDKFELQELFRHHNFEKRSLNLSIHLYLIFSIVFL